MKTEMERIAAAKATERKRLAGLPFAEKLKLLEQMRERSVMLGKHPLRRVN